MSRKFARRAAVVLGAIVLATGVSSLFASFAVAQTALDSGKVPVQQDDEMIKCIERFGGNQNPQALVNCAVGETGVS